MPNVSQTTDTEQMNMSNLTDNQKEELETAKREFLIAWEEEQTNGQTPLLKEYVRRYPQVADELVEWALNVVARQEALMGETDVPVVSEATQRILGEVKTALRARPQTLNEAREALGWSQFKLAERLELSPSITVDLSNGVLRDWPRRLELMLADVLLVPLAKIGALLANSRPTLAAHFKAHGDPTQQEFKTLTFRQALEDAADEGELSEAKKRFWLQELDAEGK